MNIKWFIYIMETVGVENTKKVNIYTKSAPNGSRGPEFCAEFYISQADIERPTIKTIWRKCDDDDTKIQVKCVYQYITYMSDPFVFTCRDPSNMHIIIKWILASTYNVSINNEMEYITIDIDNEYAGSNIIILKGQPSSAEYLAKICLNQIESIRKYTPNPHDYYFYYIASKSKFSSIELENYFDDLVESIAPHEFTSDKNYMYNIRIQSTPDGTHGLSNYANCKTFQEMCNTYVYVCTLDENKEFVYTKALLSPNTIMLHLSTIKYIPKGYAGEKYIYKNSHCIGEYGKAYIIDGVEYCNYNKCEPWCMLKFDRIKVYSVEQIKNSLLVGEPIKVMHKYAPDYYY